MNQSSIFVIVFWLFKWSIYFFTSYFRKVIRISVNWINIRLDNFIFASNKLLFIRNIVWPRIIKRTIIHIFLLKFILLLLVWINLIYINFIFFDILLIKIIISYFLIYLFWRFLIFVEILQFLILFNLI